MLFDTVISTRSRNWCWSAADTNLKNSYPTSKAASTIDAAIPSVENKIPGKEETHHNFDTGNIPLDASHYMYLSDAFAKSS